MPDGQASLKDYGDWTKEVFGAAVPTPGVLLASSFDGSTRWGEKMHAAMCAVERECVVELLEEIREKEVPGDIVEFGVYQGWWINWLFEQTEALGLTDRKVIGYDSFQGLSEPSPSHDSGFWKAGMYSVPKDEVEQRVLADVRPRIKLIEGWFKDSLLTEEARAVSRIAYARIDCDIYEPALQCLTYLAPRLSNGAILVFDDWPHSNAWGEGLAFAEWLPTAPWLRFEFLFFSSWGHLYLRVRHAASASQA